MFFAILARSSFTPAAISGPKSSASQIGRISRSLGPGIGRCQDCLRVVRTRMAGRWSPGRSLPEAQGKAAALKLPTFLKRRKAS